MISAQHASLRLKPMAKTPARRASPPAVFWLSGALLLLIAVLGLFLTVTYRQAVATAEAATSNLVRVIESGLADDFDRIGSALDFIASELPEGSLERAATEYEQARIERSLQRLAGSFEKIAALNIFGPDGVLLYSSGPVRDGVDIGQLPHFQQLLGNPLLETVFSTVRVAGTTSRPSLAQGRALRADDGRFLGVVGAVVDIDAVGELLRSVDVGPGGVVLLRRTEDSALVQRFPAMGEAEFNRPLPADNPIRLRVAAGERSGSLRYTASTDGMDRLGTFKVLDQYPFYVQVAQAESHYLAGWWSIVRGTAAIALIVLCGFAFAVTRLRQDELALQRIAHFDELTDLPNRALLADRLAQAMYRARRNRRQLAVVYLDLDGFKSVNDAYGREVGDQLLIEVSRRMKGCLRAGDTVARLGGDEFVVVLSDVRTPAVCMSLVRRLIAAVDRPVEADGFDVNVSSSVGITFYPQRDSVEAEQLLRQADHAMYQAKLAGRNRFHVFDIEQHQLLRGQHECIQRVAEALHNDELVLYYQPKVNMRTGQVIGVEALLRWQHPEEGLLPPSAFLPAIEQHRLDVEVGEWVVEQALTQAERWLANGIRLPVSVNVSAHFLQHASFVQRLETLLAQHPDLPAGWLELEVLESSALSDVTRASAVLNACTRLGVRVALDDFGTGYSSLAYLKRLPTSVLKIDQGFVRDMLHDPDDLSILEGVLGLARAFRREVIAEGVETLEHGVLLLRLGCELAQGYGIARPMPGESVAAWLSEWKPDSVWVNAQTLDATRLALLRASIEQRAWVERLAAWFADPQGAAPDVAGGCRCCEWMEHWALALGSPASEALQAHRRLHELAAEVLGSASDELLVARSLDEVIALDAQLRVAMDEWLEGALPEPAEPIAS